MLPSKSLAAPRYPSHPAWKRVGREEGCLSPPRAPFQLQPLPATLPGSLVGAAGGSRSLSEQHCYSDQVNSPPADRSLRQEPGWEGSREEDLRSLDFLGRQGAFFTCSAPRGCCHSTEPAGTGTSAGTRHAGLTAPSRSHLRPEGKIKQHLPLQKCNPPPRQLPD